jgi:hypothetical protein
MAITAGSWKYDKEIQFIKWYIVTLAAIVEIAMRGIGDVEAIEVQELAPTSKPASRGFFVLNQFQ